MTAAKSSSSTPLARIGLVAFVLLLGFFLLILRLVRWQVLERSVLLPGQAAASATQPRGAERGAIIARDGQLLAMDAYRWEVWVEPWLVAAEEAPLVAARLVEILGPELSISPDELEQTLASQDHRIAPLAWRAPQAAGEAIAALDIPGVAASPVPARFYPQRSQAAHLLGFVNDVHTAYYGVEQRYDDYLRAIDQPFFRAQDSVAAAYAELPAAWREHLPSAVGQDLVLTIDPRIQLMIERELAKALGRYEAESGSIIIMEPRTGAILAMASLPTYDPNRYGMAKESVLADPAISEQYEPGSIFKIVTVAAGMDAGLITPDTIITDTETMEIGGQVIQNWDRRGHGQVSIRQVLISSLNIGAAQVALRLEESLFYQYVRRFGFGQPTEIDLANEAVGTVKAPGDPLWSRSDLATNAFGQGLAVTPLQMARATAVIANGGLLVRPHVVDTMVFRGRQIEPNTATVRRVIGPETAALMTDMMIDVVEEGATQAGLFGYTIAGKTGTAQVAIQGGYHPTLTIASFVGFAPAHNPQFVCLVKLDKPKVSPWAVNTAAPTFATVTRQTLYLLHVPPDKRTAGPP